ncbi:hypothetical protein EAL2_c02770 [Peptoclostridium acidaminophilum DSM 3953]|uniref:Uncharacterized protein n=1 Tax=Peptoclostridium acidaminophilum DSM 3953 TaxID=1286171 RepID=W8T435_PEPAC|nr:hypothetical protein [Peptoclostridium acidaminophilum]AHM55580.1 hypothetical protein EAL2_c02770 [Peptoclostridium acidaminophilum DSM 3953]
MKVKELMEILKSLEQDRDIIIITPNRDYDIVGIREVETIEGLDEFYAIEYE